MNKYQLQGKWRQVRGSIKKEWGRLTDDELDQVLGNYDQLIGKIQERYGITKEEAQKQVDEFSRTYDTNVDSESIKARGATAKY